MSPWLVLLLPTVSALYEYGPQIDQTLPRGDDVSLEVPLSVPLRFYGQIYPQIFVNTNGLLSFLTEIGKFFNEPFPLEYPVIAPLYSNVDTTAGGNVYYRESRDPQVLSTIARKVAELYPSFPAFRPLAAFIVTWDSVGYHRAKADMVNTYQAVISSDGTESFVELLYPENGITWIRAESPPSALPDASAQAGLSSPGGKLAVLRGSGTERVYNLPSWSNTLSPGEYMFRAGNIEDSGMPEPPQRRIDSNLEELDEPESCVEGALLCHKRSACIDQPTGGFCCRCQEGFFGDGRNCLDYESHRMLGKLNISINGVESKELNMQAYIVTSDGRTYTAVSGLPQIIGYDMQLLVSLGSFVGFLFAKPAGKAPNGYILTGGVVNHTVELRFDTRHRITIKQRYSGLDLFEQLKMEAEVVGTLPSVPPGTKLNVPDFEELYTRIAPGVYKSESRQVFEVDNSGEKHEVTVHQTLEFVEHCPSDYNNFQNLRLKTSRHYLNFEEKNSILRLASTNKILLTEGGEDPCAEGHATCVPNSTCLVEDDSFRCVCNQGFQTLPDQSSDFGCVDINECEDGTANCHSRALCVNEVGSYTCQCLPGFTGDGRNCQAVDAPDIENGFCRGYGLQQVCDCNQGFAKLNDESEFGFRCVDIDECITSDPCGPNSICYNNPGGFQCECSPGFLRIGLTCIERGCDNMECPENSVCDNTNDGPKCFCVHGGSIPYCQSQPDEETKTSSYEADCDNMECPENSVCDNTNDGPKCFCVHGGSIPYCQSRPDEQTHTPSTDECESESDCGENQLCEYNEVKRRYSCTCRADYIQEGSACVSAPSSAAVVKTCQGENCWCPPGYYDHGNLCYLFTTTQSPPLPLRTCQELNNCHPNAQCIYVPYKATYECTCNSGFEGDGYYCTEFEVSCNESEICHVDAQCHYDSTTRRHMCICNEGFQGDGMTCYPTEDTGEKCGECHPNAYCISGRCVCKEGFVGDGYYCDQGIPSCEVLENCHPDGECVHVEEEGYRCRCRQGFDGDGYTCSAIPTCHEDPRLCSEYAACVYLSSNYRCKCLEGYFGNGTHCKEIQREKNGFLLLNKGRSTIRLPLNPSPSEFAYPIQISGDQQAIGIAIDCMEGYVYWSDIMNQRIRRSQYNGSDVQDFIVSGVKSAEGLTIDWINRILYWTDSGLRAISSANLNNREISLIIGTGLVNPRGIAVHPHWRKLFWSDWNRIDPIIECLDLDNGDRVTLIQKPTVQLPNSLAIDWNSNEICWTDAGRKSIECFDYSQRATRTVVHNCFYPFGLAITSDTYYWTDWSTGRVESSTKGSGNLTQSTPLAIGGDDKLYGLVAVGTSCPL